MIIKKVIKCDICDTEVNSSDDYILGATGTISMRVKQLDCGKWKRQRIVICSACIESVRKKRTEEKKQAEERYIEWHKRVGNLFDLFALLPKKKPKDKLDTSEPDTAEDTSV